MNCRNKLKCFVMEGLDIPVYCPDLKGEIWREEGSSRIG